MTPYEKAKKMYEDSGQIFEEVLQEYIQNHYVYCSPECIIFAKPESNAWFIEMAVGKRCVMKFVHMMPYFLPQVKWARGLRGGQLHAFRTERLMTMLNYDQPQL